MATVTTVHTGGPQVYTNQQVVTVTQPQFRHNRTNVYEAYPKNASIGLGISQIVFAVCMIIVNSVGIVYEANRATVGVAYWNSPCIILAGAFGIYAGSKKESCPIITTMIMSIIGLVDAFIILITSALGAGDDNAGAMYYEIWFVTYRIETGVRREAGFTINVLLVLFAVATICVALAQAIICCRHACCGRGEASSGTIVSHQPAVQYNNGGGGVIFMTSQNQYPVQQTTVVQGQRGPPGPPPHQQGYPPNQQGYPPPQQQGYGNPAFGQQGPSTYTMDQQGAAPVHMPYPVKPPGYQEQGPPPAYQ